MKAKVLVKRLSDLEAQVMDLEAELRQTRDTMVDLELCMEDCEAMLVEKGEYIAHLEEKLASSTSTSLHLEG